jgi:hypothetical protein
MFIEDLINRMAGDGQFMFLPPIRLNPYDEKVVYSLSNQCSRSIGFTEKQSVLAARLVKKYKNQLSTALGTDITSYTENPKFKLATRTVNNAKFVKIKTDENNKKRLIINFPYDEKILALIKDFKKSLSEKWQLSGRTISYGHSINWDQDNRQWELPLWEDSIDFVAANLQNNGFLIDDEVIQLIDELMLIKENFENYVPMLTFEDDAFKFKNAHKKIPQPTSADLIETLFFARQYGITTWDEKIEELLNSHSLNPVTRQILKAQLGKGFVLDNEKYTLHDLNDVIQHNKLLLVIIPGGSELENLKFSYNSLSDMGIVKENMSVLFRLDGVPGKNFNDMVKMFKLNNPLDENTKVIFVSGKIPKTLIGFNRSIDTVINLGDNSAHYTQRNLVKNHHFVINYSMRKKIVNV